MGTGAFFLGSHEKFVELVEEAAQIEDLTAWERRFIASLQEAIEDYGEEMRLSDRQAAILREILDAYA